MDRMEDLNRCGGSESKALMNALRDLRKITTVTANRKGNS